MGNQRFRNLHRLTKQTSINSTLRRNRNWLLWKSIWSTIRMENHSNHFPQWSRSSIVHHRLWRHQTLRRIQRSWKRKRNRKTICPTPTQRSQNQFQIMENRQLGPRSLLCLRRWNQILRKKIRTQRRHTNLWKTINELEWTRSARWRYSRTQLPHAHPPSHLLSQWISRQRILGNQRVPNHSTRMSQRLQTMLQGRRGSSMQNLESRHQQLDQVWPTHSRRMGSRKRGRPLTNHLWSHKYLRRI